MSDALRKRLAALFRGLERAHGTYELFARKKGAPVKNTGKARTVRAEVTDDVWQKHLEGTQGLGIIPIRDDATCSFGAIDVDKYDLDLVATEAKIAELKLPLLTTRTKSGGAHLYVFGREDLPADLLRVRLNQWAMALGFGGSEIFPKQDALLSEADIGNWINMPYLATLAGETVRYGIFNGKPLTLEAYCKRAERIRITVDQLDQLAPKMGNSFEDGPPCLQSMSVTGFPQGTRNNSLFAIGVYLQKKYPDDFESHLSTYNQEMVSPPLTAGEVGAVTKSLKRKNYGFPCNKAPCNQFCNRALCATRPFGIGANAQEFSLTIDSAAQRVLTDPPYWIITVNGIRLEVSSEHFMSQRKFIQLCIDKLGLLTAPATPDKWHEIVSAVLAGSEDVSAPPEASATGELYYHLKQFCTVHPQAETREELVIGKPWTEGGFTCFRSADFRKYLEAQHFKGLTGHWLYAALRRFGTEHKQMWINNQNVQVWCVPQFAEETAHVPAAKLNKGAM